MKFICEGMPCIYLNINRNLNLGNEFLEDNVSKYASYSAFEQRKKKVGPIHKQTLNEIGTNKGYKGTKYDTTQDNEFLQESVNPLASNRKFDERKRKVGPIHKQTVQEIGTNDDFKKPEWSLNDLINATGFLSEDQYYKYRTNKITNKNGKIERKKGVSEIGSNKHYKAISYDLDSELKNGDDFLGEKLFYASSAAQNDYDNEWTKMINLLPKSKLDKLKQQAPPTGYHTKIAWIKKLKELVQEYLNEMDAESVQSVKSVSSNTSKKKKKKKRRKKKVRISIPNSIPNDINNNDDNDDGNESEYSEYSVFSDNDNNDDYNADELKQQRETKRIVLRKSMKSLNDLLEFHQSMHFGDHDLDAIRDMIEFDDDDDELMDEPMNMDMDTDTDEQIHTDYDDESNQEIMPSITVNNNNNNNDNIN